MTEFKPGDWVECVDDRVIGDEGRGNLIHLASLLIGNVYTVGDTYTDDKGDAGVSIRELPSPKREIKGFYAWRFRPIYRPDPKLIERLMSAPVSVTA